MKYSTMKYITPLLFICSLSFGQSKVITKAISDLSTAEVYTSPKLDSIAEELLDIYFENELADSLDVAIQNLQFGEFADLDVYLGPTSGDIIDTMAIDDTAFFIKPEIKQILVSVRCRSNVILVLIYSL